MELRHPWLYIQQELTKRWRTQKDFANILGKKVSEVNELIKGKRNITIQRDILLAAIFDTEQKKWIGLQMEYDYQTESQSVDMQKITDIKTRRNLLSVEKLESWKVEMLEDTKSPISSIEEEKEEEKEEDEILPNTVAIPEESSTIQDTKIHAKDKPLQNDIKQSWTTKDRKKEHEIFRNF